MVLRITAGGGERFALVLDFNILPRLAPPKKSMEESDLNPLSDVGSGAKWFYL